MIPPWNDYGSTQGEEEPRPIGLVQPYEVITGIVGLIAILAAVYGMWGWF